MQYPEKNNDLINLSALRNINKNISLLVIILFFSHSLINAMPDSTGVKKTDGNLFIIYKVDPGQGLYGLARRYKTTVPKIQAANPGMGSSLSVGQVIMIPYSGSDKKNTAAVERSKPKLSRPIIKENTAKSIENPDQGDNKEPIYHKVTKKETLTQIAVNHNLTIDQLKSWNHEDINSIQPGDKIIVGFKAKKTISQKITPKEKLNPKDQPELKTKNVKKKDTKIKPDLAEKPASDNGPKKTVTENGMGTWVDDGSMSEISLAMHKTAPAGTIIRLTNPMNGKVKYVKVIGQLPDTDDNKSIIVKISKNTANELGIIDKDFRVRLDYSVADTTGQ